MPVDIIPVAYKGGDGYFVSADGHVYSNKIGSMNALSEYADSDGYLRVCLTINKKQHRIPVHKLVATAFHGEKKPFEVCRHIDGNKLNNHKDNLTWGSQKENIEDSRLHGTMYQGQRHHLSHVDDKLVKTVRVMYANGCTQKHISETLGISKYCVHNYVRGKSRRSAGCL